MFRRSFLKLCAATVLVPALRWVPVPEVIEDKHHETFTAWYDTVGTYNWNTLKVDWGATTFRGVPIQHSPRLSG